MYARIFILALTIGSSTGFAQGGASAPPFRTPGKVAVQVELLGEPKSLIQLIRASNLIIDGTVTGAMPPVSDTPPGRTPTIETDSFVTVNSILKGAVPKNSSSVLIEQVGGKLNQWEIEAIGDPLVQTGERYIFFLQLDVRPGPGSTSGVPRYAVAGLWAGKVKVTNGTVAFLPKADAKLHTYDSVDVNTFLQTLSETISHPYTDADTDLPISPPLTRKP